MTWLMRLGQLANRSKTPGGRILDVRTRQKLPLMFLQTLVVRPRYREQSAIQDSVEPSTNL